MLWYLGNALVRGLIFFGVFFLLSLVIDLMGSHYYYIELVFLFLLTISARWLSTVLYMYSSPSL